MSRAMQRPMGQMPAWLVVLGVAIGVAGASVTKHAEDVGQLLVAVGSQNDSSDVAMALALGQWGLGLLVVGAVVVLTGLLVIGLGGRGIPLRSTTDGRRRSAGRSQTSAPTWPSEPSQRVGGARAA